MYEWVSECILSTKNRCSRFTGSQKKDADLPLRLDFDLASKEFHSWVKVNYMLVKEGAAQTAADNRGRG